jgi:multidrug efflux pump subunit AcrB
MQIANVSIDRPVFTTMVALGAMVMGVLGLSRLGLNLFPDVTFPVVAVSTVYPGAGPSEIEEQVTRPIEDAVSTVNGVDEVRSFSRDSVTLKKATRHRDAVRVLERAMVAWQMKRRAEREREEMWDEFERMSVESD